MDINADSRRRILERAQELLGSLRGKTVGLLGLTFKPNTDDLREAPALEIAQSLLAEGASVRAYDPVGMPHAAAMMPALHMTPDAYELAQGCDAVIVCTEWNEFKNLDLQRLHDRMRQPLVIDGRNIYDPDAMASYGFHYRGGGAGVQPVAGEGPRVSAGVHLRAIVESTQVFPPAALILSATAPLDQPLAAAVERNLGGRLLEMFASTETCVFAHRYTAGEESWRLYDAVRLEPADHGTWVDAPWFPEPVAQQDILELQGPTAFRVRGRNTDMIEVAGKRASLGDLTRRVLAIEGVRDAVVFQPDRETVATVRRVAALVVAPGFTSQHILDRLACPTGTFGCFCEQNPL